MDMSWLERPEQRPGGTIGSGGTSGRETITTPADAGVSEYQTVLPSVGSASGSPASVVAFPMSTVSLNGMLGTALACAKLSLAGRTMGAGGTCTTTNGSTLVAEDVPFASTIGAVTAPWGTLV